MLAVLHTRFLLNRVVCSPSINVSTMSCVFGPFVNSDTYTSHIHTMSHFIVWSDVLRDY